MKRILKFHFLFVFAALFSFSSGYSQSSSAVKPGDPFQNPVILAHYTLAELQQVSPEKLTAINYYYTQSFILEPISCSECKVFDKNTFDVSQFEQLRKQSERYVREYSKYGYRLTLLSKDELQYESVR